MEELVKIIGATCLKYHDSGEASYKAKMILQALEDSGYKVVKDADNFDNTLTKEQKDAETYFDWDNETIGKMTRHVMEKLKKTDMKGFKGIFTMASCHVLIQTALSVNADTFKTDIGGFTVKGEPKGDWEVIVKRKKENKKS